LKQVLYGLPCPPGALPQLSNLAQQVKVLLMIDHESQIDAIEAFHKSAPNVTWSVFVKVDMGSKRAGLTRSSPRLKEVIQRIERSPVVSIYGFYCHAGHSYNCRTVDSATNLLHEEVAAAAEAATLMANNQTPVVLSVGATPTAHVITALNKTVPERFCLELHAGTVP
jgi:D-serine ammonia-lyase